MKKLNQKGAVDPLLVVVVVLVIAVGAFLYYRINSGEEAKPLEHPVVTKEETQEEVVEESTIPEGWVEYTSEELGVTFIHPESWGAVTVERQARNNQLYEENLPYRISFSSEDSPYLSVIPDNWQYNPPEGVFGGRLTLEREKIQKSIDGGSIELSNTDTEILHLSYNSHDGRVYIEGLKKLEIDSVDADQIEVIRFDSIDDLNCIVDQRATLDCYPEQYRNDVVNVLKSVEINQEES